MEGKTNFSRRLKHFGGLTWLTLTRYFTTDRGLVNYISLTKRNGYHHAMMSMSTCQSFRCPVGLRWLCAHLSLSRTVKSPVCVQKDQRIKVAGCKEARRRLQLHPTSETLCSDWFYLVDKLLFPLSPGCCLRPSATSIYRKYRNVDAISTYSIVSYRTVGGNIEILDISVSYIWYMSSCRNFIYSFVH